MVLSPSSQPVQRALSRSVPCSWLSHHWLTDPYSSAGKGGRWQVKNGKRMEGGWEGEERRGDNTTHFCKNRGSLCFVPGNFDLISI